MMDWNDNWGAGDWVAMSLMMLLFWGALIGLVVWLVVTYPRNRTDLPTTTTGSDADRILAARYARGEIDEDELTRRLDVLHGAQGPVSSDPGDVGRRAD